METNRWLAHAEDQAFLREMSRDIVAMAAIDELDRFDAFVDMYFQNPTPPTDPRSKAKGGQPALVSTPRIATVTPAAIMVVLNYLIFEAEEASLQAPTEGIKHGIKRLLRHGATLPGEGIWLLKAGSRDQRLRMLLYAYTLPLSVTVATAEMVAMAATAGGVYGLPAHQCVVLSNAVLARFCRDAR